MTIMQNFPDRKTQTHDRIVEVAARAIRRAGYDGIGVADIMKEAGLTHGGFYAHFASRDAMLVEAIQRAGRDSDLALAERIAQRRADGEGPFAALVNSYLHDAHLANVERGCLLPALASEMPRQREAVLEATRLRLLALIDLVRRALPAGTMSEHAPVITASMIGALQMARTLGSRAGRNLLAATRQSLIAQHAAAPSLSHRSP